MENDQYLTNQWRYYDKMLTHVAEMVCDNLMNRKFPLMNYFFIILKNDSDI